MSPNARLQKKRWLHAVCTATAGATLALVMVGGLVTNTGSALAVPDWPTTFGYNMFTYPPSQWIGGVLYEHSHRLLGSLVGFLTILLLVAAWRWEDRPWVRWLSALALVAVVLQGVLGGMRVVLLRHELAIIHGCFAQAFFGLLVTLWVVTSETWERLSASPGIGRSSWIGGLLAILVPGAVFSQIALGALVTHRGQALWEHIGMAGVVATLVLCAFTWVMRNARDVRALRIPVFALAGLVSLQLSLGLMAYLWHFTNLHLQLPYGVGLGLLAAHRMTGTLLWGTSLVFALRLGRVRAASLGPVWHGAETGASKAWT
ncbi:MAG: cytochrome aa3 oxidase assembly protein CtaA [Candidatus Binatia bacterium]|nr:MAG: cytochrome aa3 oxidase assembly protein CtaA [Candidatus Binatia bacterium]